MALEHFLIVAINSLLLETVYAELLNGDNNFVKCFARCYVAVLRLEIVGRIVNFFMPSPSENLWILP